MFLWHSRQMGWTVGREMKRFRASPFVVCEVWQRTHRTLTAV